MIIYCSNCGVQYDDSYGNCPNCGAPTQAQYYQQPPQYAQPQNVVNNGRQERTPYQIAMASLGSAIALPCVMLTLYFIAMYTTINAAYNSGMLVVAIMFHIAAFVLMWVTFGVEIRNFARGIRGHAPVTIVFGVLGFLTAIYLICFYIAAIGGAGELGYLLSHM